MYSEKCKDLIDISSWYQHHVGRWRTAATIGWIVILVPLSALFLLALSMVSLSHPLHWILCVLSMSCAVSTWTRILGVAAVAAVVASFNAKHYTVVPTVLCTRLAIIWTVLKPTRVIYVTGHILASSIIAWLFTSMLGGRYAALSHACSDNSTEVCLNEHHVFIMLLGFTVGCIYASTFFLQSKNLLHFSPLQQCKFFEVKTSLAPLLFESGRNVLHKMYFYYPAYYLVLGRVFKQTVSYHLGISKSEIEVDTLTGLLDFQLAYHAWLAGTLVQYIFSLSHMLYQQYHTEAFEFPVSTNVELLQNKTLHNALGCMKDPLVQYLGYLDLSLLAKHSAARRTQVFSLTKLGGHPYNWTNILTCCITCLREFNTKVSEYNIQALTGGPTRHISGESTNLSQMTAAESASPGETGVASLTYRGPSELSTATGDDMLTVAGKPVQTKEKLKIKAKIWEQLKKRPAVAFFVSDLSDTTSCRLFADSQKYIWAVEALSFLVCASFTEDKYGVVQKSLADIMTALLDLQQAVEKHFKVVPNISRKPARSSLGVDAGLRFALRASLKDALYRIVTTFNEHLSAIPLSTEHMRRLRSFLDHKE